MLTQIADGRTDLILDYIEQGNPAISQAQGVSLASWCAYYGDVSALKFLLARGEKLESLGDNYDLGGACFHGHWRLCQFLIEQGANVNHADAKTGETALHAALCKANRIKYTPVVELLLSAGADPNLATRPGIETESFMRDFRTKGETALHRAAAFGNERDIELLLEAGARRDTRDANGDTPLSWASWYLRPGSILGLLCYGEFRIHPERLKQRTCDAASSMDLYLQGTPHLQSS